MLIIGLYLWSNAERTKQYLYSVGNYIFIIAIIAAGSRGVMMLFPLVLGVYLIFMPAVNRKKALASLMIAVTAALFANYKFLPYLIRGNHSKVWLWFCAGIIVTLWGTFLAQMLKLMWRRQDKEKAFLAVSIFAAVLMLGMHSFIDYDLAFGAYGMLMFGLMGYSASIASTN